MYSAVSKGANKDLSVITRGGERVVAGPVYPAILAALCALLLLVAHPALAQTESVLNSFTGTPDGASPTSRLTSLTETFTVRQRLAAPMVMEAYSSSRRAAMESGPRPCFTASARLLLPAQMDRIRPTHI